MLFGTEIILLQWFSLLLLSLFMHWCVNVTATTGYFPWSYFATPWHLHDVNEIHGFLQSVYPNIWLLMICQYLWHCCKNRYGILLNFVLLIGVHDFFSWPPVKQGEDNEIILLLWSLTFPFEIRLVFVISETLDSYLPNYVRQANPIFESIYDCMHLSMFFSFVRYVGWFRTLDVLPTWCCFLDLAKFILSGRLIFDSPAHWRQSWLFILCALLLLWNYCFTMMFLGAL